MSWTVDVAFGISSLEGIGVFANQPIRQGTRVWEVDRSMKFLDQRDLRALGQDTLTEALRGGYLHAPSDRFIWYSDGMQFLNHGGGSLANIGLGFWPDLHDDHCVALRDIAPGEELLEDYTFWSNGGLGADHWLVEIYRAHCPEHFEFLSTLEHPLIAA